MADGIVGIDCDPGITLGTSTQRDLANVIKYGVEKWGTQASKCCVCMVDGSLRPAALPQGVAQMRTPDWAKAYQFVRNKMKPGQTLMVLISGHGTQVPDQNGDEIDGKDEMIVVDDFIAIRDDELYKEIVLPEMKRPEHLRVKLRLVTDTCHSGTMFDLLIQYQETSHSPINPKSWKIAHRNGREIIKRIKGTIDILSLSACKDSELAYCDISHYGGFGGALTSTLLDTNGLHSFAHARIQETVKRISPYLNRAGQTPVVQSVKIPTKP